MNVLVSGGLGYVGTVLVPHLAKRHRVTVYDSMLFGNSIGDTRGVTFVKGDMLDTDVLQAVLRGQDAVIHLAGVVTDELVDMNPEYARKVNVKATGDLCFLALVAGVKRFIYASSSSVYGSQAEVSTEGSPTRPETAYAQTKLDAERICLEYSNKKKDVTYFGGMPRAVDTTGMSVTAVRSATCCGPAPRMRLDTIVNVFSKQAYFDGKITVFDGTQYRSNIHVQDVAEFYALLLEAPSTVINGQVFNAVREFDTARGIAAKVKKVVWAAGRQSTTTIDAARLDGRQYRMSGEKARKILRWEPARSIEDAIWDNCQWFASGGIGDPNDPIYFNTRRMKDIVMAEQA